LAIPLTGSNVPHQQTKQGNRSELRSLDVIDRDSGRLG